MHQAATTQHQAAARNTSHLGSWHKGTCSARPMSLQTGACLHTERQAHLGVCPGVLRVFLSWSSASRLSTTGSAKASVLPLPVLARAVRSVPSMAGRNTRFWMGNRDSMPRRFRARTTCWCGCGGSSRGRRQQQQHDGTIEGQRCSMHAGKALPEVCDEQQVNQAREQAPPPRSPPR